MPRIMLFQSFLLLANGSSVQKLFCIFRESNSMLENFLKSLITNFNHINIGLPRGYFMFLQASCKAFRAGVSLCNQSKSPYQLRRFLMIFVLHVFLFVLLYKSMLLILSGQCMLITFCSILRKKLLICCARVFVNFHDSEL